MGETDFLFARPSFVEGISRVLDFGGTLNEYNRKSSPQEADSNAILNDFLMVGNDITTAIDIQEEKTSVKK